jgi:hypothetical protein
MQTVLIPAAGCQKYCQIGQQNGMIVLKWTTFCEAAQLPVIVPDRAQPSVPICGGKRFDEANTGARCGERHAKNPAARAQG